MQMGWNQIRSRRLIVLENGKINIDILRQMIRDRKIRWTNHVIIRLVQRNITQEDVETAILNGKIIEKSGK